MIDGLFNPRRPPGLTRALFLLVMLAIAYLSLHPMSDWRLRQPSTFAFLMQGIPRHYSTADLVSNVAAYLIFGLLLVLAWSSPARPWRALLFATATGLALSIALESMQSWLPQRVPSLLDVAANGAGAAIGGALGAVLGLHRIRAGHSTRQVSLQWYQQGPALGWALLAVWVIGQIPTHRLLFSSGHPDRWIGTLPGGMDDLIRPLQAWQPLQGLAETLAIMVTIGVIGVLVMDLIRPVSARLAWIGGLLVAGLTLRVVLAPMVYRGQPALVWLTSGAQAGLVLGAALLYLIGAFGARTRLGIGAALVPVSVALVVVASADPYFITTIAQARHPLDPAMTPSLRSLINLLGDSWPLLAFVYFVVRLTTQRKAV